MSTWIGLMSGTSMDAVDAALVRFDPEFSILNTSSTPIPESLKRRTVGALGNPAKSPFREAAELDALWGDLFAEAANSVVTTQDPAPEAIGSHGQTLWHEPSGTPAYTLQIGDPNRIAAKTGITTVADFRRRDIAHGGQGAPLAPAFHAAMLTSGTERRAIVNIGGISNVTKLYPGTDTLGYDTGPGNTLMDLWAGKHLGQPYDENGKWAASGKPDAELLSRMLGETYFSNPPPKSSGREHFNQGWLEQYLAGTEKPEDVQATLIKLTAQTIARECLDADRIIVCGGGAHNPMLMTAIRDAAGAIPVETSDAYGIAPDWMEAAAFAWLAKQTLEGKPGNLPSVTGAERECVLGAIYPA